MHNWHKNLRGGGDVLNRVASQFMSLILYSVQALFLEPELTQCGASEAPQPSPHHYRAHCCDFRDAKCVSFHQAMALHHSPSSEDRLCTHFAFVPSSPVVRRVRNTFRSPSSEDRLYTHFAFVPYAPPLRRVRNTFPSPSHQQRRTSAFGIEPLPLPSVTSARVFAPTCDLRFNNASAVPAAGNKEPTTNPSVVSFTRRSFLSTAAGAALAARSASAQAAEPQTPAASAPAVTTSSPPRRVTWGYAGETGPNKWASLTDEFAACGNIGSQSPVAISYRNSAPVGPNSGQQPSIEFSPGKFVVRRSGPRADAENKVAIFDVYIPPVLPIVGDTPPIDLSTPTPNPAVLHVPFVSDFKLKSFHFHAPTSEHVVDNSTGVVELHFVFTRIAGSEPSSLPSGKQPKSLPTNAVVGILFNEGKKTHPWLKNIFEVIMPDRQEFDAFPNRGKLIDLDVSPIVPDFETTTIYSYDGSLTTPPGSEGIKWFVCASRPTVTRADMQKLCRGQGGDNVRPTQTLGNRSIVRYTH